MKTVKVKQNRAKALIILLELDFRVSKIKVYLKPSIV